MASVLRLSKLADSALQLGVETLTWRLDLDPMLIKTPTRASDCLFQTSSGVLFMGGHDYSSVPHPHRPRATRDLP